jgi:hypothetical protein
MKLIQAVAFLTFTATAALAQTGTATVTGAIDASKNRTTATEAKHGTRAGNRQAIMPANAGNEAAQQISHSNKKPDTSDGAKPH